MISYLNCISIKKLLRQVKHCTEVSLTANQQSGGLYDTSLPLLEDHLHPHFPTRCQYFYNSHHQEQELEHPDLFVPFLLLFQLDICRKRSQDLEQRHYFPILLKNI